MRKYNRFKPFKLSKQYKHYKQIQRNKFSLFTADTKHVTPSNTPNLANPTNTYEQQSHLLSCPRPLQTVHIMQTL